MSSTDVAEATYTGSCHCGAFVYTVKQSPPLTDPSCEVASCNCSICARNGYLHIYVHGDAVAFTKGEKSDFAQYRFNSRKMVHYFCGTCGVSCMVESQDPEFYFGDFAVNVRTFEGVELEKLKIKFKDTKNA